MVNYSTFGPSVRRPRRAAPACSRTAAIACSRSDLVRMLLPAALGLPYRRHHLLARLLGDQRRLADLVLGPTALDHQMQRPHAGVEQSSPAVDVGLDQLLWSLLLLAIFIPLALRRFNRRLAA